MAELDGDDDSKPPRLASDTNAEVLPSRRQKAPTAVHDADEGKKMSKRKKRKLEQLAQKKASKELRTQVLEELKAVQLTAEQAELLRASQSTRLSKRQQKAMAQRRAQLGVPLTSDMKDTLKRRPRQLKRRHETEAQEGGSGDAGSDEVSSEDPKPSRAMAKAAVAPPTEAGAGAPQQNVARAHPPPSKAKAKPKAEIKAPEPVEPAAQPLVRVHVQRTTDIEDQRSKLPAVMMEQEFTEMVLGNDVMLVCGDTGCGKSTQVPQFLYECGLCNGDEHLIGVTQPRRVAAISVSQRVGQELNQPEKVGYQVRYDKSHCTKDMRIKFMTDGILLREVQADFLCRKYTAIVIDEAHERGVNCDILIGLLSRAVQRRRRDYEEAVARRRKAKGDANDSQLPPPLKLVIMSATLRLCDFTENNQLFPSPPPVLRIDARTFPVTVHFARRTDEDYIKAAHRSVLQIHKELPPGSILVFVTGRQEVHRLCRMLQQSQMMASQHGEVPEAEEEPQRELELEASDDEAAEEDPEDEVLHSDGSKADNGENPARCPKKAKGKGRKRKATPVSENLPGDPNADAGGGPKPKKKRRKKVKEAAHGEAATTAKEQEEEEGKLATQEEMPDLSFALGEEDTVLLESEAAAADEDAKDRELRNQRKVRMTRLDKSRTAGGVFKGTGFGEGPMRVLPLYAQLSATRQLAPFADPPEGERVVVISTNVAETSVTLPNVRYVVDTGKEKRRRCEPVANFAGCGYMSEVVMQQHAARRKDWAAWQVKEEELCDEIRDLNGQLQAEQQERDQAMGRETILEQELRAERRRRIDLEAQLTLSDTWKAEAAAADRAARLATSNSALASAAESEAAREWKRQAAEARRGEAQARAGQHREELAYSTLHRQFEEREAQYWAQYQQRVQQARASEAEVLAEAWQMSGELRSELDAVRERDLSERPLSEQSSARQALQDLRELRQRYTDMLDP
ncbi:kz [Symbiodinium natans]|uniref:RNA helicase n=1 Tax=Symbiodinium natans TaxID=878477 RepID=A0A812PJ61_9DINO|nr:kz [Symbiodinium natans]